MIARINKVDYPDNFLFMRITSRRSDEIVLRLESAGLQIPIPGRNLRCDRHILFRSSRDRRLLPRNIYVAVHGPGRREERVQSREMKRTRAGAESGWALVYRISRKEKVETVCRRRYRIKKVTEERCR